MCELGSESCQTEGKKKRKEKLKDDNFANSNRLETNNYLAVVFCCYSLGQIALTPVKMFHLFGHSVLHVSSDAEIHSGIFYIHPR